MKVITGGNLLDLGVTETAPTIGIIDYSRRVTDDFGVTTVVERGFARRMSVRFAVPFDDVDVLQRRLADLRATPARWVADDRFASLSFEGFYKDFEVDLAVPPVSYCTLTVEGLVASAPFVDAGGDPAPEGQISTLRLLQPVPLASAMLKASSIPETDHPEWSAATSYAAGVRVVKAATHRVYESMAAANVGNDPAGASGKWVDVGPTNRWAMLDQALGTTSTAAGQISMTLAPGAVGALALLDVVATSVRLQAPGYDRTMPAGKGAITFLDLPGTAGDLLITIIGNGTVSVGTLLVGRLVDLGVTEASPSAGITDFSRKEVDEFGEVTVVQRAWAKRMTARALIRTDAVDQVAGRISAVRARPSLWIGQAGLDSLTVYGFFKDFSIEIGETVSKLSLSIEGLSEAAAPSGGLPAPNWPDIVDSDPERPKPEDGATVGAPDWTNIGSKPVKSVLGELSNAGRNAFDLALSSANQKQLDLARYYIAGMPTGTLVKSMVSEVTDAFGALAEKIDIMLAKSGDGNAVILNEHAVQVGTISLAQWRSQLSASIGAINASVSYLTSATVDAAGNPLSKAVFALQAGNKVVGVVSTNDGKVGAIDFVFDRVRFLRPDGVVMWRYDETRDVVVMPRVEIDTLKLGAMDPEFLIKQSITAQQGSQVLPGGVVMKWGQFRAPIRDEVQLSVIFDTPFPTACQSFVPTPFVTTFNTNKDLWLQNVGQPTRFGAAVATQAATGNDQNLDGFDWIAFGK